MQREIVGFKAMAMRGVDVKAMRMEEGGGRVDVGGRGKAKKWQEAVAQMADPVARNHRIGLRCYQIEEEAGQEASPTLLTSFNRAMTCWVRRRQRCARHYQMTSKERQERTKGVGGQMIMQNHCSSTNLETIRQSSLILQYSRFFFCQMK